MKSYDKIIIGAGLYGLYSALFCARRGEQVIVLECDSAALSGRYIQVPLTMEGDL